ncbi:hypothetical protein Golob_017271, partial [Gossypium lobatum]|nr:hypothetical protein [Gossypium lobatum]
MKEVVALLMEVETQPEEWGKTSQPLINNKRIPRTSILIRGCFVPVSTWTRFIKPDKLNEFLSLELKEWLCLNFTKPDFFAKDSRDWDLLLGTMPAVAGGIYLCATASVAKTTVGTGIRAWRSIRWNPPPTGWLKTIALWGAFDGVDQAWKMGYRQIMLELDSSIAVNAINSWKIGSSEIRSLDIFRSYWAENG